VQGNDLSGSEVWWYPGPRFLFLCAVAFVLGLLLPFLLPADIMSNANTMAAELITDLSKGTEAAWSGFSSVLGSYLIWAFVIWLLGWLPSAIPATLVFFSRLGLFGFCLMILMRADYSYGLLVGLLVLLPGEILLSACLGWQCLMARCQSLSLKNKAMFFSPWRYMSLGLMLVLPAFLACWLKTSAGPFILDFILSFI
jgi:hypothetical protein